MARGWPVSVFTETRQLRPGARFKNNDERKLNPQKKYKQKVVPKTDEDTVRTTSTYDVANQLNTSVAAAGTTTYTFDADGNQQLVLAPNGDLTTTTWNYENQPTKIAFPAGTRATYTYNADNRRVRKET